MRRSQSADRFHLAGNDPSPRRAVKRLPDQAEMKAEDIGVIGFHGQTVMHAPEEALTWQIGDGALLAAECGIDVLYDFRSADMQVSCEGAPFTPVYHRPWQCADRQLGPAEERRRFGL